MDYNSIVIGAGPAGLSASLYLKRAGLSVLLIDKDAPGGQMLKTSVVDNYLGFESINGAELALAMFNHVKKEGIPFEFSEVIKVSRDGHFVVETKNKQIKCKNVIIATGRIPEKLNLPGEDSINGISYCATCDGTFYKDKVVGVVGGGNSALTNALYLSDLCRQIYVFVRSDLRAHDDVIQKVLSCDNITILKGCEISEFISKDNSLTGVILKDGKQIELEGLFVAIGGKPQANFISNLERENGYILVNDHMETSVKNVYACGDVISKDYYQIITAASDGAVAALSIKAGE